MLCGARLRVAMLCGARLRVAMLCGRGLLAVLGCELVIWVAGGRAGLRVAVEVFGFSNGETEMRDRGERV